jgi:Tfp pilus assembly protein PilP
MRSAHALVLGILLALAAPNVRAQSTASGQKPGTSKAAGKPAAKSAPAGKPATPAGAQAAGKTTPKSAAKPAPKAATAQAGKPKAGPSKTASQTPKAATGTANAAAKPAVKAAPAKDQKKTETAAKKPRRAAQGAGVEKKAAAPGAAPGFAEEKVARRDPFESLIGRQKSQADASKSLPPGKAGLLVNTLKLDGIVRAPNGMIAVVSNPQQRTYFLREGDQLYDGRVEKILMDSVSFHEVGRDAFGKPVERQVNKRLYPSPGEQQ